MESLSVNCGRARGTTRLGAPELDGVRTLAFLNILRAHASDGQYL
ncbi:hypothetical protein COMA2_10370 [Candidatus Nitrospira nitrificans]|uniref:Uncharacterized protein n=2 Tax=Candidatus Nitrospira nitrificans TaxID=1742973 RepID=A0A0S4L562_9BACT|nr:hypothetical protein COMA2_10370 [Candidatus Nitrospira nitrificans]